jgi:hypothetical protein
MDTLTLKIHDYDEETHSLIVSFGTDAGEQTVDEYQKFTFNIHNYNPDDIQDTLKQIAKQGAQIAHQQWLKEQSMKNDQVVSNAKAEIGKVYNFPIADLLPKDNIIL